MELLSPDDPVYVIDLGLTDLEAGTDPPPRSLPEPPKQPIRAVALLIEPGTDPVLIAIEPTRDVVALDAAARLLRVAVATGTHVRELALEHGDATLVDLYRHHRLPCFIYEGLPVVVPEVIRRLVP